MKECRMRNQPCVFPWGIFDRGGSHLFTSTARTILALGDGRPAFTTATDWDGVNVSTGAGLNAGAIGLARHDDSVHVGHQPHDGPL